MLQIVVPLRIVFLLLNWPLFFVMKQIGPNVSISANARIGAGSRLISCIILDDVEIKVWIYLCAENLNLARSLFLLACQDNAVVIHAIVGWKSSIGRWSRVQASWEICFLVLFLVFIVKWRSWYIYIVNITQINQLFRRFFQPLLLLTGWWRLQCKARSNNSRSYSWPIYAFLSLSKSGLKYFTVAVLIWQTSVLLSRWGSRSRGWSSRDKQHCSPKQDSQRECTRGNNSMKNKKKLSYELHFCFILPIFYLKNRCESIKRSQLL